MFSDDPGNFAILTHIIFRPLREADYPHARAFRRLVHEKPHRGRGIAPIWTESAILKS